MRKRSHVLVVPDMAERVTASCPGRFSSRKQPGNEAKRVSTASSLMERSRRSGGSRSSSSYGSLLHHATIQNSGPGPRHSPTPSEASYVSVRGRQSYCANCRNRIPRGKGSLLVFLINVVESFAFYGAIDSTLRFIFKSSSHETAITLLVQFTAGRLMYPIAGFLSDVYFGRYRMIQIGIWLFWVAFALLSLSLSLAAGHIEIPSIHLNTLVLPIITFVLICAGSGAIEVTIIPFGVDHLSQQGASSHEQSSYFYWFYFGRQLGNMAGILSFHGLSLLRIEENSEHHEYAVASIQSIVGLAGMTFALALTWWFKDALFKDRERENPLRKVAKIMYYNNFRYDVKYHKDGEYDYEEIKDMKAFCKILLVLLSLGLCFMTYTGVYIMLDYHISNIDVEQELFLLFPDIFILCNNVTILIALPILNFVFLPRISSSNSANMRERIGFGVSLIILSSVLSTYLEWCILPGVSPQHRLLCLLLPTVCVSLGELLLFVTGLEFIYAQSPEQMKGLLTGLFYLVFGLFSGAASLVFLYYPKSNHFHNFVWYFTIYSVIGGIGLLMYIIVACLYSNKDKPGRRRPQSQAF